MALRSTPVRRAALAAGVAVIAVLATSVMPASAVLPSPSATKHPVAGAPHTRPPAAAPRPGSACAKLRKSVTFSSLTYTCTKQGAKLVWSKGVKVVAKLPKLATAPTLRLGFFANVTHAAALIAIEKGFLDQYLGADGTKVEYTVFNAGPSAIEAIKGGAIDATYIGPNPSISGFVSTDGQLIRIVSGATSGGAQLVVKSTINTIADLKGKTIATPQLGNTQDVALRAFLKKNGYNVALTGQGDVNILPTDNATTLALFQKGSIDGAWLPEPWASRLVLEANAKVLVDESTLWKNGDFITTNIIAETNYLAKYPGTIRSLILANNAAITWAKANAVAAKDAVQAQLLKWSGKKLSDAVINRAWDNLRLNWDPLADTLKTSANNAVKAGVLSNLGADGIRGIYDLRLLNQVLKFQKQPLVTANKLGLA